MREREGKELTFPECDFDVIGPDVLVLAVAIGSCIAASIAVGAVGG